jgi:hypothetical protein
MTKFTIGCDPEIFLVDEEGKPVSAYGLIPGTKAEPYPVNAGAIQVDGIATEFNTDPVPLGNFDAFNANIVKVIAALSKKVKENNPGTKFLIEPVLRFDQAFIDAQPDDAKALGCDPDYNAYTLEPNPRPDGDRLFRTGAGHLHIGWGKDIPVDNDEHIAICADFVKMLDCTVGMVMTFIDREPDRRELYGKAGAFRPKSYGVEYRTPSNVWIRSKTFRGLVHSALNRAIEVKRAGKTVITSTGLSEERVRQTIDEGDYQLAKAILDILLPFNADWRKIRNMSYEDLKKVK